MANPRALVKRRKSVQNTRKITKTMEMVSTARMAKAQVAAMADYSLGIKPMTRQLAVGDEGFIEASTGEDDDCF